MSTPIQVTATAAMPASAKKPQNVQKEDAMWLQKEMINSNYHDLATAHQTGRKVSATFVPGNLNELLMCFDFARSLPETNALQNGLRKKSGKMIMDAERDGQSEDVCTYVKADLGMMMGGEIGPTGEVLPKPDILLLSYTGCFTFMKWFELIRHKYGCETVMLHVPYQGEGKIAPNMREYVVKQLKETVIPTLERISGVKFDIDRLRQYMRESAEGRGRSRRRAAVGEEPARRRSTATSAPSTTSARSSPRSAACPRRPSTTACCARRSSSACAKARVRSRRTARWARRSTGWSSKARRTGPASATSGRCSTTRARSSSRRPTRRSAASTTSASATMPTIRWSRSPTTASAATRTSTCRRAIDMICKYIDEYQADGLLINSIKSCNSFSAGQLLILREVEKRTGKPAAFIETDLVDPRYFSAANVKNRLESYFQMVKEKRVAAAAAH